MFEEGGVGWGGGGGWWPWRVVGSRGVLARIAWVALLSVSLPVNMLYPFSFVLVMFTSTSTRKGITQPSFTDTINDLRPMQVQ